MRLENSFIMIPGIGRKTEKKLWKNDTTHWDHIHNTSALSDNKRNKAVNFIEKAQKNLEVGNTHFFRNQLPSKALWRIYQNFREDACFFDIETTGLDQRKNKVTTVSFHRNGENKTLVRGQDLTEERLKEEIFESSMFVSFNGKRFDQPFLEHNFDIEMDKPHVDLMYLCKRLGFTGGLKKIEKEMQINRELEDIDGREAVRLWKKYEKKGNEEALRKLVKYNQYDAENLKQLFDKAHRQMTDEIFTPHYQ